MIFTFHLLCTLFVAMIFWGRWEHFYNEGLTLRKDTFMVVGEMMLTIATAYMLYLMWVGK